MIPRFHISARRGVLFGTFLLVALIALVPLSLALNVFGLTAAGLAARDVRGSIWLGHLSEAQIGRVTLGDVAVALDPLPLVVGRARINMTGETGRGAISLSRHARGVDDVSATLTLRGVFAPVPLDTLVLDDLSVAFRDGVCSHADGLVRATFAADVAGLSLSQGLSGEARCDAGMLLLPLAGQSGMESLMLRIAADGHYRAEFGVRSDDASVAAALSAAGFVPSSSGYVLRLAGTLT